MVLQKRLGHGSRGRQARATPRVPTLSLVKRSTRRKKNEMYALHLLATVAATLSTDQGDSSSRPVINETAGSYTTDMKPVKSEQFDEVPPFQRVALGKDCCKAASYTTDMKSVKSEQFNEVPPFQSVALGKDCCKAASYATNRKSVKSEQLDEAMPFKSVDLGKDCCKGCRVGCAGVCAFLRETNICLAENSSTQNVADTVLESLTENPTVLAKGSLVSCTKPCRQGYGLGTIPEYGTIGVSRPWSKRSAEVKQVHRARPTMIRSQVDASAATRHSLVDTMDLDTKPPSVVGSDGSSGLLLGGHDKGHNSSALCWGRVQHAADRDDDENSSGCMQPSTSESKGGYLPHYIGDCRTRRLFAARFRKAARNKICGGMSSKGSKLNFCGKKRATTRRRVQPQRKMFKTKRLAECYFAQPSDEGILTETSRTSFCMRDQDPPHASERYHVKLTIKSFNVPELSVEIPENATVGSLKKIVMDAVTTTIEGSLRVGVLLQGKIIQDDNKTLHQAGIRHGEKLDNLGFTLECEAEQDSYPSVIAPEETDSIGASVVEPLSTIKREEPFPETRISVDNQQPIQAFPNCTPSDPGDCPFEWTAQEKSMLVPLSKSKRSDSGQRRKRTPFSVAEVEVLVKAVEQFGTGRWRHIKFHAFETAEHRTYVDLKDKWKNLVHTASIPAQLRRGKAIPPQELLDRVLAAQAFWSLQQAKCQDSPPAPEICLE